MRWSGRMPQKIVLERLIRSHQVSSDEEKCVELCSANRAGEQLLWWYRVTKSYCNDYKDGVIVGYDEPLGDIGLQGFDEEKWSFFKKADVQYLGRAACNYHQVKTLLSDD